MIIIEKSPIGRKGVKGREVEKEINLDLVRRKYLSEGVRGDLIVALAFITKSKGPEPQGDDQTFPSHQSRQ